MSYKHANFNFNFRLSIDTTMRTLGLLHAGSNRQVEKGTLIYYDPIEDCYYGFYESGYCRRLVPTKSRLGSTLVINGTPVSSYQLNKTIKTRWNKMRTKRILAGPDEQLGRVIRGIISYRNR